MPVTSYASGAASAACLSAGARNGVIFVNTDANRVYINLSSDAASATTHSFSLAQNENACVPMYTGAATYLHAADGTGHLIVTEY